MAKKAVYIDTRKPSSHVMVETYPLKSIDAAEKMASKRGNNRSERAEYARVLVEESRALGSYIADKNARAAKKAS